MIPVQPPNLSNPLSPSAISPLKLLTEGDQALLDVSILPARLPNLVIGEQVSARIAEQLSDNQVAVLIKNALFTLTLPPGLQPKGDTLNLRVVSLKPGLSFALQDSEAGGENKDSSVQVDLSPASRYLTRLLSAANQDDAGADSGSAGAGKTGLPAPTGEGLPTAVNPGPSPAPLLKNAADLNNPLLKPMTAQPDEQVALDAHAQPPAQMAGTLKQGVENSGLFYESHLKAWDLGKQPLSQLQQEPQAKIGQTLQQGGEEQRTTALPALGNLVQRQLDALESRQVPVQGFAWPGQPMQMTIQPEESDERQGHGDSDAQAWTSHLVLNLPVMGGLSARVRLVGNAVQVSFSTEETAAGDMIQQNSQKLADGLAAAGLNLATLSIKHEETPTEPAE